jgi:predicted aspartyl protease
MYCYKNIKTDCSSTKSGKKIIFLFISFLLFFLPFSKLIAQEEFIPSPSRLLTSFPFTTFTGGIIIVKLQLGNYPDSLNFILDTGSGGISLDSETCVRLKIEPQASDKTIKGIAGIRNVKFVYNEKIHIGGLAVDSLNFHVSDYDILSSVYGDKIDGIMGYSFFSRYIVKIDYDSSKVYVYTKGYMKYPKGGFLFRPVIQANIPVQYARIKEAADITERFYFDTGAGLCLLLSTDFVTDSGVLNSKKKLYTTQAEGLGGKTLINLTTIKELRFGPHKFKNVPTFVFDDEYNVTSYPSICGLIGSDILRRFNMYLNYDRRDFYLVPNSHYRDPFDYSYTGLGIYWIDGSIRVGDVMKDSPAEKAGFQVDDIIISMNNTFNGNLQAYKNILQNTNDKVKVIVKRPSGLSQIILKVKSIL